MKVDRFVDYNSENHALVSFVIPFLNEREVLPQLLERLALLSTQISSKVEFVFVDDGSSDGGTGLVEAKAECDQSWKLVILSRNFGHQAAISAGLQFASGDFVCVMDADLQDPPELVVEMLKYAKTGTDVVYARRRQRAASVSMNLCYKLYYRLLNVLADTEIPLDAGDFCLMSRKVVDALLALPESQRFLRGLRSWVGFKQQAIEYSRPDRAAGTPKYTLKKLFALGFDGIFSFSTKPLQFATYMGFLLSLACFLYTIYAVLWRFLSGESIPGFATIAVGIFFLGAVQLIGIGILGEYLGRVYQEVKRRPSFVIERSVNLPFG